MDYQTFWDLTPKKLAPFVEAFKQRQEHAAQEYRAKANFSAWLQGIYIARAIAVNFSKNTSYFDQPIVLTQQPAEEGDKGKADAIKFACWAKAFNQQFQNKKPEERV
ncbi:MAG: hypothetical protein HFE66_08380 [Clostridiales bacterium]|nr:hypothetical protein [Clostridiales bacterium]